MKVADADEAVRLANDSPFGLNAFVFGRYLATAPSAPGCFLVRRGCSTAADTLNDYREEQRT